MNNSDLINKLENAIQAWEISNEELRRLLRQHILDLINVAGAAVSLGTIQICNSSPAAPTHSDERDS